MGLSIALISGSMVLLPAAAARAATYPVSVFDTGYSPRTVAVAAGDTVQWSFVGPNATHTATDTTGMGLFDSGPQAPGGAYAFTFVGAGIYPYADTLHPSLTGTVRVPVSATPSSGTIETVFAISWASAPPPPGYVFDLQTTNPLNSSWVTTKGLTAPGQAWTPTRGAGTYRFRARLRNAGNGAASQYSPAATVSVQGGATTVTVDSSSLNGRTGSVTTGTDGLPLISYTDAQHGALKVAHCAAPSCSSATRTMVDAAGAAGRYTSIAIGSDGLGVISYYEESKGDLRVAHCSNVACTAATVSTVDSAGNVGKFTSVGIGADGLPLVAYMDAANNDLKVAHCTDVACTSATITRLDSVGDVGRFTNSILGTDGLVLIAYYDVTNGDLKAAHCSNVACTAATLSVVDSAGDVGHDESIALGSDGLGIISYYDTTNGDLKTAHCSNVECSAATTSTIDGATTDVGQDTGITIGADGVPLISYTDVTNADLKVARCADIACTAASTATLDAAGDQGQYTSDTIGGDGLGFISYWDATNDHLKAAHCLTVTCGT